MATESDRGEAATRMTRALPKPDAAIGRNARCTYDPSELNYAAMARREPRQSAGSLGQVHQHGMTLWVARRAHSEALLALCQKESLCGGQIMA